MSAEHFETCSKKGGRGMAQRSIDLIEAMYAKAEAAQPITGRGVGYKLFTAGLIPSMPRAEMQRVYRLLKEARERGDIPWEWIVDETRTIERTSEAKTSKNGKAYLRLKVHVGDGDGAQWVSVLCFDADALAAAGKLLRGARVYCVGKPSTSEWTGKEGEKRLGLSVMS